LCCCLHRQHNSWAGVTPATWQWWQSISCCSFSGNWSGICIFLESHGVLLLECYEVGNPWWSCSVVLWIIKVNAPDGCFRWLIIVKNCQVDCSRNRTWVYLPDDWDLTTSMPLQRFASIEFTLKSRSWIAKKKLVTWQESGVSKIKRKLNRWEHWVLELHWWQYSIWSQGFLWYKRKLRQWTLHFRRQKWWSQYKLVRKAIGIVKFLENLEVSYAVVMFSLLVQDSSFSVHI